VIDPVMDPHGAVLLEAEAIEAMARHLLTGLPIDDPAAMERAAVWPARRVPTCSGSRERCTG